jgi:hypothetical protein
MSFDYALVVAMIPCISFDGEQRNAIKKPADGGQAGDAIVSVRGFKALATGANPSWPSRCACARPPSLLRRFPAAT